MSRAPRDGPVKSHLEQLIGRHSRESGVAADRVRRWVSTMALLGALERAAPDDALPLFLLKGGVAIEGVRTGARATKDVDVVFGGEPGELLDALDAAFAEPYCDFAFRRGAPAEHGPHATRFDVRLTYQTRGWATVRLEISGPEHGADEPEYIEDQPAGLQAHRPAIDRLPATALSDRTEAACRQRAARRSHQRPLPRPRRSPSPA